MFPNLILTKDMKAEAWGPGEWVDEPDIFEFEHAGFTCFGSRVVALDGLNRDFLIMGHWCGYVLIPQGHPWHGKEMEQIEAECHGGITHSKAGYLKDGWSVGFDCAHSGDLMPSMNALKKQLPKCKIFGEITDFIERISYFKDIYRDIEYVKQECRTLAEDAKKAQEDHGKE